MNKLAVITGATSGIGAEFARQLATTHKTLWLIGRREQKLNQLAEDLRVQYGIEAHVMIMDLSDQSVIDQLASQLQEQSQLSTLVNNAGYAEDGEYHKLDWRLHEDIMNVHVEATLKLSYAALQVMTANKLGSIINVSSVASFLPTPSSPLYGPTKAFIRTFSESLAIKYKDYNIKIQALCPGFTVTDFHEKIGLNPDNFYKERGLARSWSSEFVVKNSLQDLQKGKVVSVPGWNYKLIVIVLRLVPISWILRILYKQGTSHRYSE
ncbi:MAG: SDR family NAD(P)-dependent oxidoreductase [Gammaproteobacteria bacterium]|nr:SDR family NAD(P)-dependent oxidoreductase [Gammaproteobacteria bacterium]